LHYITGDNVSRATKGITIVTVISKATIVSKVIVASVIVVSAMWSKVFVAKVK
jgi:hypothetical protein